MRRTTAQLLMILSVIFVICVICVASPVSASPESDSTPPADLSPLEAPLDEEEQAVEDFFLELLVDEPRLCCQVFSLDSRSVDTLAGLLFWSRIKILCKGLRPTAIC